MANFLAKTKIKKKIQFRKSNGEVVTFVDKVFYKRRKRVKF